MLDAAHAPGIASPPQDVAQHSFAPTPSGSRPSPRWYVAATHAKAERRAHATLHLRGWQAYLPLITTRLPNRHYRTSPLWPGYLFVLLDLTRPWHPVTACPGVFSLLSVDGMPSPCPDGLVEALQAGEAARQVVAAENAPPAPGALVAVANGVLQDCHGVVLRVNGNKVTIAAMIAGHLCTVLVPLHCLRTWDE